MGNTTAISWCDVTWSPWIGCTEVSIERTGGGGCDHCYARTLSERYGWAKWGAGEPRHRTSSETWKKPHRWNRQAEKSGKPLKIFSSLCDPLDNEVPETWRSDYWSIVRATPHLRWLILTKHIANAARMLPPDWPLPNAGLMETVVNQKEWNRDWPPLRDIPAAWHGISMEPLLGSIDIGDARPDWIIVGGESGQKHRPLDLSAVRSLERQCRRNGIAFHFKQIGGLRPTDGGCLLDGREHKAFPPALAV